ncbi:MAG: hypothetical protein LBV79_10090 [Candidatus Adiutrix sp.]|jgi:hypothetical protein|nr:hypothetical protein [Candidatus Adiutrix sp.]
MKKVLVLLSALTLLTGCVSGGGGSGSAGGGSTQPPVLGTNEVFSVGDKVVPVKEFSDFSVSKTADGLVLTGQNDGGLTRSVTFQASDFVEQGDFLVATKKTSGNYGDTPGHSYNANDDIALGGKKLGLSHSDFGMWDAQDKRNDALGNYAGTFYTDTPFYMGVAAKQANFTASSGTHTFSGTTIAIAHGAGGDEHLTGTAALNVDFTAAAGPLGDSNLYLHFANFADFAIPLRISNVGFISQASAAYGDTIVTNQTTGKDLTHPSSHVLGQFYGDSPNSPSEAVGEYEIQSTGGGTTINGSFGVKK